MRPQAACSVRWECSVTIESTETLKVFYWSFNA